MKARTTLLLPSLLCYLLPIARTLAHCSLAFCQTWFLTPASSLPLFLLCCHAASLLPHLWLSEFPISPSAVCMCGCVWFSRDAVFTVSTKLLPAFQPCFSTFICSWYEKMLLWYPDINTGSEPDSHIAARSQARAFWNRDCCTRRSLRARIHHQAYWLTLCTCTYTHKHTHTSIPMLAVQKER